MAGEIFTEMRVEGTEFRCVLLVSTGRWAFLKLYQQKVTKIRPFIKPNPICNRAIFQMTMKNYK